MSDEVEFELVPIESLKEHERVDPAKVRDLIEHLRATGVSEEPIWVARGSHVILNGHHRYAALKALGARRVPAWVVDYDSDLVSLGRWKEGPAISKEEVVRRARARDLFPVKTTRHSFSAALPPRPTPLSELMDPRASSGRSHARPASGRTPSRG
jgi:L-serine kinase (ADP)